MPVSPDLSDSHIAVVGAGAAGLSAAWLLSKRYRVTLLEKDDRLGGHAHTATVSDHGDLPVDTGFIVYNEPCYPNFTAWMAELGIETQASNMSFSVSREDGKFEYGAGPRFGLLAQPSLVIRPRFWSMLRGLLRFYREAPGKIDPRSTLTLGEFLTEHGYSQAFIDDHLMPFAAAVWSAPCSTMLDYPAYAFIRFCDNHGLLKLADRPQWRTVSGGSHRYVNEVKQQLEHNGASIIVQADIDSIERFSDRVVIKRRCGRELSFDAVVLATHADQALSCLAAPDAREQALLGSFTYESNLAVLHTDTSYLPRRTRAWCSWNYVEKSARTSSSVSVSYWMNRLQDLPTSTQFIVSLNPDVMPDEEAIIRSSQYQHPVFTVDAWRAQQELWSLQGRNRTWFCGSYFGAGFHEDAVQAGFAAAESVGGCMRPWTLENPSSRIVVNGSTAPLAELEAA